MKFKVGDRVKVTIDRSAGAKLGECGTVIGKIGDFTYQVKFDEYDSRRHNCCGMCDVGYGWNFDESYLEPACADGGIVSTDTLPLFIMGRRSGKNRWAEYAAQCFSELGLPAYLLSGGKVTKINMGNENTLEKTSIIDKNVRLACEKAKEAVMNYMKGKHVEFKNGNYIIVKDEEDKPMKLTFSTTEGYRIDKSNNTKIPTITTQVDCIFGDLIQSGSATCDKFNYDERQGVLEAVANALFRGKFDREYNRAVKCNKEYELAARTCNYCGRVFDTTEERKAHEDWHVERRKARHERYLLRKRAKEIAFEEQAQKMAKEMIGEQK